MFTVSPEQSARSASVLFFDKLFFFRPAHQNRRSDRLSLLQTRRRNALKCERMSARRETGIMGSLRQNTTLRRTGGVKTVLSLFMLLLCVWVCVCVTILTRGLSIVGGDRVARDIVNTLVSSIFPFLNLSEQTFATHKTNATTIGFIHMSPRASTLGVPRHIDCHRYKSLKL